LYAKVGNILLQEERKAWFYATGVMLVISMVILILRLSSIIFFTMEFEIALVYIPTIVLIAISTYVMRTNERFPK
jgi:hypothetical protein